MSRISRKPGDENGAFICRKCSRVAAPSESGTRNRNHCPHCLWSLHVDLRTGDRRSGCRGEMEPAGVRVLPDGEWALIHRCVKCGFLRSNRIAGDDNEGALLALALRPVMIPPFPAEKLIAGLKNLDASGVKNEY
jgi:RNHCP domain